MELSDFKEAAMYMKVALKSVRIRDGGPSATICGMMWMPVWLVGSSNFLLKVVYLNL